MSRKLQITLRMHGAGALDEMGFWQARFEVLGSLQTQLDMPHACSIIAMLRMYSTDRNLLGSFQSHFGELSRVRPVHFTWLTDDGELPRPARSDIWQIIQAILQTALGSALSLRQ